MTKRKIDTSTKLFIHRFINGIADATIKVFIPLIIYQQTGSLIKCFSFCSIMYLFTAIFFLLLKNFIKKHSVFSIIIHVCAIITECFLLTISINWWLIVLLAFLSGFETSLYYGTINNLFAGTDKSNNVAKFESGALAGKILFTIASAYILGNLTNSLIFVVIFSSVLYLLGLIPILMSRKELNIVKEEVNVQSFKQTNKQNKLFNIFHIFTGVFAFVIDYLLPIYLFYNNLSFSTIGIIIALGYLIQALASFLSAWLDKKKLSKYSIIINGVLISICFILIIFIKIPVVIYIVTILINFCYRMIFTVMFSRYCFKAKQTNSYIDALAIRDSYQNMSRAVNSSIFLVLPIFVVMLIFGAISGLGLGITGLINLKEFENQFNEK